MLKPYCISCKYPSKLTRQGLCVSANCLNPKSPMFKLEIFPMDKCTRFELAPDLEVQIMIYLMSKLRDTE